MALDVFVGSLARYYRKKWKDVERRAAGPGAGEEAAPPDPKVEEGLRDRISLWRQGLQELLRREVPGGLPWDEAVEAPWFTDRPGEEGWNALVLSAAHHVFPGLPAPAAVPADLGEDEAWRAFLAAGPGGPFLSLLGTPGLWLPADFPGVVLCEDPFGRPCTVGSSVALVRDLKALNDATWKGGGADFRAWRAAGLPGDLALEPSARFAFAIFLGLGNRSLKHGLPMVLAR